MCQCNQGSRRAHASGRARLHTPRHSTCHTYAAHSGVPPCRMPCMGTSASCTSHSTRRQHRRATWRRTRALRSALGRHPPHAPRPHCCCRRAQQPQPLVARSHDGHCSRWRPPLAAAGQRLECAGGWPWHTSQPHEQQLLQMQPLRCSWLIGSNSPEMVRRRAATHAHSAARALRQRAQSHTQPVTGVQSQHPQLQWKAQLVPTHTWMSGHGVRALGGGGRSHTTLLMSCSRPLRLLPCLPQKPLQRPAARQAVPRWGGAGMGRCGGKGGLCICDWEPGV